MKKMRRLSLVLLILLLLYGCSGEPAEDTQVTEPAVSVPAEHPADTTPSTDLPEVMAQTPVITETQVPQTPSWEEMYTAFLTDNYDGLMDACIGGMAGVGFIDLDIDGTPELIVFDFGASAAMGVQIFGIYDGVVECVSANMSAVGERYGGTGFNSAYVNAGLFEDFRLMEDLQTGRQFFCIESGNGAMDFSYSELIIFNSGTTLGLEVLMYKYEDFDTDGNTLTARYEYAGQSVDEERYKEEYELFKSSVRDTGYDGSGTFIWENSAYYNDFTGFMSMVDNSLKNYTPTT